MGITDLSPGQQPHPGLTWLIEQIEALAEHTELWTPDHPSHTANKTQFVAFANGARKPEGTPAPSTRDMSEWDVLRATLKAVVEYRATIEEPALLTWRTAPEVTYAATGGYPEVYLRLAFEPVRMGVISPPPEFEALRRLVEPNVIPLRPRDGIGEGVTLTARQVIEALIVDMDAGAEFEQLVVIGTRLDEAALDVRATHGAPDAHWLCHKAAQMLLGSPRLDGEG